MQSAVSALPSLLGTPKPVLIPSSAFSVHPRSNGLHSSQHARIVSPAHVSRATAAPSQRQAIDTSSRQSDSSEHEPAHLDASAGAVAQEQQRQWDDLDVDFSLQESLGDRLQSHANAGTSGSPFDVAEVNGTQRYRAWKKQGHKQHCVTQDKAAQFSWVDNSRGRSNHNSSSSRHTGDLQRLHAPAYGKRQNPQTKYQTKDTVGPVDPPLLTKFLTTCNSLDELYGLFFRHHHRFNHIHVSCAMNRLAWLRGPKSAAPPRQQADCVDLMLATLEAKFVEFLDLYSVREVANALWSWAKLEHQPSEASLSAILSVVTANNGALLTGKNAKPKALANLAWGACKLHCRNRHVWALLASAVRGGLRAQASGSSGCRHGLAGVGTSSSNRGGQSDDGSSAFGAGGVGESHQLNGSRKDTLGSTGDGGLKQQAHRWPPQQQQQQQQQSQQAEVYFPVDLSLVAWSYASARMYHCPLFDDLADVAMDHLSEFCPQDLTNMLWAFAQVGHPAPALFEACVPAISSMITGFTPQGMANLAWAYTKAGLPSADVLGPIARQASRSFHALEPVHISQLVWSMVKGQQIHKPLMQAALAAAAANTHVYKSKELALMMWAVAVTAHPLDKAEFQAIGTALLQRMAGTDTGPDGTPSQSRFCPQDVANTVYAYSKSGVYDAEVYDTAVRLCMEHQEAWLSSPEAFRGTVWSLGHAGHYDAALFTLSAHHLRDLALEGHVPLKVLACVLQPLAMMRHYDPECCEAVCQHVHTLVNDRNPEVDHETLANVLWSLVVLGHQDLPLMRTSFAWVRQHWQQQQRREAGELFLVPFLMVSLCEVRLICGAWVGDALTRVCRRSAAGIKQRVRGDHMLYLQAYLWLQDLGTPEARDVCAELPRDLVEQAGDTWRMQAERQASVSEFQLELHEALTRMGLQPRMEHITVDSLFSVDMVIQLGRCKLAVEANGPSHYTATSPSWLLGNKVLRDNFLRKRGYMVLNVAWYKWLATLHASDDEGIDEFLWSELLQAVHPDSEAGKVALSIRQQQKQQRGRMHS
ncbi:hypothetical protein DUNSADRAFT_1105 [Dunaliella salina]|uniref:RAP domain-containing protein n=1 Tax=Dunaliella salina TaxID=3046 RepID=A0ABQ7GXP8_DUNSA|nr:hypothetical protein DUNSADRAFT_1105 [Dunaliella salina]|eukprot:KAF5839328.1 hypothetical protein DUNSADRAFT_1105 [Dunaliella salina]